MGEAVPPLGNEPGPETGPDLRLVEAEGQDRPFFNLYVELQHSLDLVLANKRFSHKEKTIGLADFAFRTFLERLDNPDNSALPSASELTDLFHFAKFLYERQYQTDVSVSLEMLDEVTAPFTDITPIGFMETFASPRRYRSEPQIGSLMVKIWVHDHSAIEMPSSFETQRQEALQLATARSRSHNDINSSTL